MNALQEIPELKALDSGANLLRIPSQQDVPLTARVRRLIDSAPLARLKSISQLGLVSLVYPGATHSRFEHSLGVYRNALLFLKRLSADTRFAETVSPQQAEEFIVAALLHDVGHWPYCHPIEDLCLDQIPDHEHLAAQKLQQSDVPEILQSDFGFTVEAVCQLLANDGTTDAKMLVQSMLSGPVDVDKMDYLYRDSLHAGVPYGMHFDRGRLMGSLCVDQSGRALAITNKGCTAAELMVMARYVMFSEVYWHHTVRSATAMLQRAFFLLQDRIDLPTMFQSTEPEFQKLMMQASENSPAATLVQGLFGEQRRLYKRAGQVTVLEDATLFQTISRRPAGWLVEYSAELARRISQQIGKELQDHQVLVDAPPPGLEVQFQMQVAMPNQRFQALSDVSPVVRTLAQEQFDNYVKKVRVFVAPEFYAQTKNLNLSELMTESVKSCD